MRAARPGRPTKYPMTKPAAPIRVIMSHNGALNPKNNQSRATLAVFCTMNASRAPASTTMATILGVDVPCFVVESAMGCTLPLQSVVAEALVVQPPVFTGGTLPGTRRWFPGW